MVTRPVTGDDASALDALAAAIDQQHHDDPPRMQATLSAMRHAMYKAPIIMSMGGSRWRSWRLP
jgi:hypothetical protein